MATDLQMSADNEVEFPYRALSRSGICSVILLMIALLGLIPTFEVALALAILGLVAGLVSLQSIRRYPNEYSGMGLARFAIAANALLLVGGISMHTYIYMTEVPPGHVRVPFFKLKFNADPDRPTPDALKVDGEDIFVRGYIHPASGGGMLRQFILVGDLGTCCFGGQPKSSEMIEVTLTDGQTIQGGMTRRKLAGKFTVNDIARKQTDFDNPVFYRLKASMAK
ncbi:MAG: hypothetical protein AAFU85_17475 [Planctomycetota bacterium]